MKYLGIDIGSTAIKAALLSENGELLYTTTAETSWDSSVKALAILDRIASEYAPGDELRIVATGYGRVNVDFADKTITEISCHAKGAAHIFGKQSAMIVDIGGQDTKIIALQNGRVADFLMNDKCSAGTGRFLQVMAHAMNMSLADMCELARDGQNIEISSMCTVFAESEVVSLIAKGAPKKDIAHAIIVSMANKVKTLCSRLAGDASVFYLTGGLCELDFVLEMLSKQLGKTVESAPNARFAGAIGAALFAMEL